MRNKTMRRSLAWLLTAATVLGSVPVSAEELVTEQSVDLEAEAQGEGDQVETQESEEQDSGQEENIDDNSIESDITMEYADDTAEESTEVIDGTSDSEVVDEDNTELEVYAGFEDGSADVIAPTSSVQELEAGTYNVCANIVVLAKDNEILTENPITVYMTGTKFPPVTPRYEKNTTLSVEKNGDVYVTIPLDGSPASIFTLQELKSGTDCEVVETKRDNEKYGNVTGRITEVKVKLKNLSGQYTFGDCTEYPTILNEYKNMPLHIYVDLANAEKVSVEEEKNLTLTDEESGAVLQLSAEDPEDLKEYKGATLHMEEVNDSTVSEQIDAALNKSYIEIGTYEKYRVQLLTENGQLLTIKNNVTAQLVFEPEFKTVSEGIAVYRYKNQLEKIDAGFITVDTEANSIGVKLSDTGYFVVVDESSSKPWAKTVLKSNDEKIEMDFYYGIVEGLEWSDNELSVKIDEKNPSEKRYWINPMVLYYGSPMQVYPQTGKDYAIMQISDVSPNAKIFLVANGKAKELEATIEDKVAKFTLFSGDGNYGYDNSELVTQLITSYENQTTDSSSAYLVVTEEKIATEPSVQNFTYSGKERTGLNLNNTIKVTAGTVTAKDAGTYTVAVKPADGYTWYGGSTEERTYTWIINKGILSSNTYTYLPYNYQDGTYAAEWPTIESVISGMKFTGFADGENKDNVEFIKPNKLLSGNWPDITTDLGTGKTYTLIGGSAKNYNVNATHRFVIGIDPEKEKKITESAETIYTGTTQSLLSLEEIRKAGFTVKDKNGKTIASNYFKDAGVYEGIMIQPTIGFAWSDGSTEARKLSAIEIKKATLTAKVNDQTIAVYDGTQNISTSISGFVAKETKKTAKNYVAPSASLPEKVEPNHTYSVKAEGGSAKNYEFEYESGNITIGKVAVNRPASVVSIPYTGKEIKGVIADGEGYTIEGTTTATNAGTYKAVIKLKEGYVWNEEEYPSEDMEITWKIIPATADVPQTVTDLVYNGSEQTGVEKTTGVILTGTVKATNAGTYTAKAVLADNYQWEDGTSTTKTITWSIDKKSIAVPSTKTLTYNGSTQTGVAAGNGYHLTGSTTAVNAGTYKATAVLDKNYKWSDQSEDNKVVSWTIQKAKQNLSVKTAAKKYSYTSLQKKAASFKIGASGVSYKITKTPAKASKYISVDKNGKVTLKKKAPAGTYVITVSKAGNANYEDAKAAVTVTVEKAGQKITAKNSAKKVKASAVKKKAVSYTIGAKAKGSVTYQIISTPKDAGKYISVSKKGKVTLKKGAPKGTYVIRITAKETSVYKMATKNVKITVK